MKVCNLPQLLTGVHLQQQEEEQQLQQLKHCLQCHQPDWKQEEELRQSHLLSPGLMPTLGTGKKERTEQKIIMSLCSLLLMTLTDYSV